MRLRTTALTGLPLLLALTGSAQAQLGVSYCSSNPNSTGVAAELAVTGSPRVEDNLLRIDASGLPRFSFGFFLVSQDPGATNMPGGSAGVLCLGGSVGRYNQNILQASTSGQVDLSFDLGTIPHPTQGYAAESGDTLYFQYWFRDSSPSGTPTSNFSSGVRVDFACDSVDFATGTVLHPLPWTRNVPVSADFNGDGRLDLAAVARSTNELAVALQGPSGTFGAPILSAGTLATMGDIAAADVDLDGDQDLFVIGGSTMYVFLNDGAGRFTEHASISISTNGWKVKAVDLDLDGWPDAVINRGSGLVSTVFMGPGGVPVLSGQAQSGIDVSKVFVGDLDGDSLEDLFVTSTSGNQFVWLKNLGNRFFATMSNLPTLPGFGLSGQTLDLDGDGDLDVWYWRRLSALEGSLINDGGGNFTLGPGLGLSVEIQGIAAGDLDSDGDDDLLYLDFTDYDELTVALQGPAGTFSELPPVDLPFSSRYWTLGDFNADGNPDFAGQESTLYSAGFSVLLNNGSADFTPTPPPTIAGEFTAPIAADWNGDGREDVIYNDANGLRVIENNGSIQVADTPIPGASDPSLGSVLAAVDLNGDGALDLISRRFGGLRPLIADAAGSVTVMPSIPIPGNVQDFAFADFTGDGLIDTANLYEANGSYRVQIRRSLGDGTFALHSTSQLATTPTRAAAGDIDGDGHVDLALLSASSSELQLYLNDGGGTGFTAFMNLPIESAFSGPNPRPLVEDFDLDGDLDILVAQEGPSVGLTGIARLFENVGGGSFMASVGFWPGLPPVAVLARDMDRDGDLDLVFSGFPTPAWTVLMNNGAGQFGAPQRWLGIGAGASPLPVDINDDGVVDVLSFRFSPSALGIHLGTCD